MSADERESQLSAMFDGELPESECELLARRLSRDPALKQQWARYSLIGAVIRNEPLHAHRAPGGRLGAGIAARLSRAIEAEAAPTEAVGGTEPLVAVAPATASAAADGRGAAAGGLRWGRPAAGMAIAAGVAALSVFWLQARGPQAAPAVAAVAEPVREVEVIAPPASTRGAAAEVVVAGNGYPGPANPAPAVAGSGEPESYVVPLPAERRGAAPPAQLANYVVAHSEFSGPLSRRSLLSALVAADATAGVPESDEPGEAADAGAEADGRGGAAGAVPGLRSAEAPK